MIRRWIAFWDERETPTSLALTRVLVASVILVDLAWAWFVDLVPDAWAPPPFGLGFGAVAVPPPASAAWFASPGAAELLFWIAFGAACLVLVGWFARPAGFVLVLASAELARFAPSGDRGIDVLLRIAVLVLSLSRADARWSVAVWLRRRRQQPALESAPAWPRYLLFAQVLWVYFSAAHNRGGPWGPSEGFSAIGRVLSDPSYTRFAPGWTAGFYPLTQLATAVTMAFELSAPLLLLWTWLARSPERGGRAGDVARRLRLRWAWLALGASLHLGIAFTLRLGIFPFAMLALYPVFLHPSELEALVRRFRHARARAE